jgi:predicted patatin/cPLA2 family phospholipase
MEIIKGIPHSKMLPAGTALVLEGGGTRGFYSSGVFEAFIEHRLMFRYIAGVSAGAANALSYISGQPNRSRRIVEKFVGDPRYVSRRNLITKRSLFGYDFIFDEVPNKHLFFDWDVFNAANIRFLTGVTDCETGEAVWYEKDELDKAFTIVRASCSVPLVSKIVKYEGRLLLDGGVAAPIPIDKSIADGNTFHVIVLTQNAGYKKTPFKHNGILRLFYSKYPKLIDVMLRRHEIYNRQVALCEQLEREGRALIIRPLKPLNVGRSTADVPKLLELYDEGHEEGRAVIKIIEKRLSEFV